MRGFLFISMFILSLTGYAHLTPIVKMGVEQGLSNEFVVSITQDKDGFLWFATEEGLNKLTDPVLPAIINIPPASVVMN